MKVILDMDVVREAVAFDDPTLKYELTQAGCSSYYEDPNIGATVYKVDRMPNDHILVGIKWVEVCSR